jgi:hypothetical protein
MKNMILAVDPGKASGISCFTWEGDEPVLVWSGEYQPYEFAGPIASAILDARLNGWSLDVACESFTITPQTGKNSQAPYSLEQIGVLKHLLREGDYHEGTLHFQNPSDAKRMFTNEALKKLGYWHKGGEGHALDSIRHGLLYLAKHGWTPRKLLEGY